MKKKTQIFHKKIRKRLFGLNTKNVDHYLNFIQEQYEKRFENLQQKILQFEEKNKKLAEQLQQLRTSQNQDAKESILQEYAKKRVEKAVQFLDEQHQKEIQQLQEETDRRLAELQKQEADITHNIQNTHKLLHTLIEEFSSIVRKLDDDREIQNLLVMKGVQQASAAHHPPSPILNGAAAAQDTESRLEAPSSFWDDISDCNYNLDYSLLTPASVTVDVTTEQPEYDQEETSQMPNNHESAKQSDEMPKTNKTKSTVQSKESQGLTEEIDSIQQRYLVGKIAGKDLRDGKGRIIVSRNSIITSEIVKKANEEGVLSDLIINMKIPDLGE